MTSSHKLHKQAVALLEAVKNGQVTTKRKNILAKVIPIIDPGSTSKADLDWAKERLNIGPNRLVSQRAHGIAPCYNEKIFKMFLFSDLYEDKGTRN